MLKQEYAIIFCAAYSLAMFVAPMVLRKELREEFLPQSRRSLLYYLRPPFGEIIWLVATLILIKIKPNSGQKCFVLLLRMRIAEALMLFVPKTFILCGVSVVEAGKVGFSAMGNGFLWAYAGAVCGITKQIVANGCNCTNDQSIVDDPAWDATVEEPLMAAENPACIESGMDLDIQFV